MTLDSDDLNETDQGIVRLLERGRCSPRFIARELDRQQPYISQRLKRLVEHGHVHRVDRGLYELVDEPGDEHEPSGYRERAIREYGEECQVCGAVEDIVVHHRDGDRGNNAIENLIPLCETCHGKVHGRSDDVPELVRDLGYRPTGDGDTTLRIREELADELYSRKSRGESYEDVIWRLIDPAEGGKAEADRDDDREVPHTPDAVETPDVDDVRTQLKDVTFPSTKERDTCIAAVVAAREYLREYESASMRDFVTDVMPDHPIGYSVPDLKPGERYRGSWWRKVVKPGLSALHDIEPPSSGGSDWEYTRTD